MPLIRAASSALSLALGLFFLKTSMTALTSSTGPTAMLEASRKAPSIGFSGSGAGATGSWGWGSTSVPSAAFFSASPASTGSAGVTSTLGSSIGWMVAMPSYSPSRNLASLSFILASRAALSYLRLMMPNPEGAAPGAPDMLPVMPIAR